MLRATEKIAVVLALARKPVIIARVLKRFHFHDMEILR